MNKSIIDIILLISRKSQIYLGSHLKKFNITAAEAPFFLIIKNFDGMTQEELTAIVNVDKAVTTRVIQSLEKKNFIKKVQDKKDKRQNRIYATDQLKKIGPEVIEELKKFDERVLKGIDEKDIDISQEVLLKIEENFMKISKENIDDVY